MLCTRNKRVTLQESQTLTISICILVAEAIKAIATASNVDENLYGLFLPPHEKEVGRWLKDDYPLEFYDLTDINPPTPQTRGASKTVGHRETLRGKDLSAANNNSNSNVRVFPFVFLFAPLKFVVL